MDAIVDQCQGEDEEEKVNNLLDRFDSLISHMQDRESELEEVVQKLGTLHGNVNQLESWLANAVHSLKRESADFDHDSLKNKIENLYRQKTAKQTDLNKIKQIGRALINDPNTGDKNRLRETLADTQAKWHDLTELLVQMISFAVSTEEEMFPSPICVQTLVLLKVVDLKQQSAVRRSFSFICRPCERSMTS